jgi:hypothetical protein
MSERIPPPGPPTTTLRGATGVPLMLCVIGLAIPLLSFLIGWWWL